VTDADVIVIGAGFAGLSAAVMLAGEGKRVVVLEEAPRLGGRASAFTDRETGERVDNGQHVLFGCYRETYAFLRTIGAEANAPLQRRLILPVAGPDGTLHQLDCPRLPPPWHLIAGVLRWSALGWRDRLSVARIGGVIRQARRDGPQAVADAVRPDQTVAEWLSEKRQTDRLRAWLWNPLAVAALNQSPETAAAPSFVRVLAELFGPRVDDAAIGLSRVPLDELFGGPATTYIESRGGSVRLRSTATIDLDSDAQVRGVRTGGNLLGARSVISSVPWYGFERLWGGEVPDLLGRIAVDAAAVESSPIVTLNLWLDAGVMPAPFVGLVHGPMHWVFDKSAIFGEHAGHLSVVASGAESLMQMSNDAIAAAAIAQLADALPAMRGRSVLRSVVVRERRATFSLAPGAPRRPATVTPLDGFYLAGDWTDTGLPATIEGAVLSGHRAARAVLERRDVQAGR
jgi:hydroxysqualene dehydroxylase